MTTAQKIIKYCAVAFALFLAISIIGGIISAVAGITGAAWHEDVIGEMQTYPVTGTVERLAIDLGGAQVTIKEGDSFSVASDHKRLTLENENGLLRIGEESHVIGLGEAPHMVLTIPADHVFDWADISTGAGTVKIDALTAGVLTLELGAGEVRIDELTALERAKIDGGAGELTISGGGLNNLTLDLGVGEVELKSRLTGDCAVSQGVGELSLTLLGAADDYSITLDKGVGSATLNGEKMHDGETYGSGVNTIRVDGGVGEMKVKFAG